MNFDESLRFAQDAKTVELNGKPPITANNGHQNGYIDVYSPATLNGELSPQDQAELERSSISADVIAARGYFTAQDPAFLRAQSFPPRAALVPGLVIPLHNYKGERVGMQLKPRIPRNDSRGRPIKYESPSHSTNALDFSPLMVEKVADLSVPLVIVEGIKKGDSGTSHGLLVMSFIGVDSWRGKNETGAVVPLPDWEYIPVKKRIVAIAYDSDAATNPNVDRARARLATFLSARGATVKIVDFPAGPNGAKVGLDDFFTNGGTVAEFWQLARDVEPVAARRARQITAPLDLPDAGAITFPELKAEQIPAPKLTGKYGAPEYDARQIVEILRPGWEVVAMTTHAAHAARIAEHLSDSLKFCPQLGWTFWNDSAHWEIDDRSDTAASHRAATLSRIVRAESAALYRYAATLAGAGRAGDAKALSDAASELLNHAKQIEGSSFVSGALKQAAGNTKSKLRVKSTIFDLKPWRIGFINGTWDCGRWRENLREDYFLHTSSVEVDFTVDRAEWLAVLDRITGGDELFARTLQDVIAYIFSGASHLRFLPWFYGPKGTGKSTIAELIQTVLDGMAVSIDPAKLQGGDSSRERLGADIWNKRAAICQEVGTTKLEAQLLKTLAGGDSLPVRFLFRESFTATPRHVLVMVANDAPRMDAYDDALRDRVKALPFTHPLAEPEPLKLTGGARIEAVRKDPNSPLVRGFTVWALEGLTRFYKSQEIFIAPCVNSATTQFWADTDPITDFWDVVEKDDLLRGVPKNDLRIQYDEWCRNEGQRPLNRNQWTRACEAHGLVESRNGKIRSWILGARPKAQNVTQVTQIDIFPISSEFSHEEDSRESENGLSSVTCVTKPSQSIAYGQD